MVKFLGYFVTRWTFAIVRNEP